MAIVDRGDNVSLTLIRDVPDSPCFEVLPTGFNRCPIVYTVFIHKLVSRVTREPHEAEKIGHDGHGTERITGNLCPFDMNILATISICRPPGVPNIQSLITLSNLIVWRRFGSGLKVYRQFVSLLGGGLTVK